MEYRRKCNVCGKIYCYTSDDVSNNTINAISSGLSSLGAIAAVFGGGTRLDMYALNSQADRYDSKIVKFERCPSCHSMDTVLLSNEELAKIQRKSEASDGKEELSEIQKKSESASIKKELAEIPAKSKLSDSTAVKTIKSISNSTVESFFRRAYQLLKDAEWPTADAYFEKVLNVEPENAQAYLGKLFAELQISSFSELQTCGKEFEESSNWKKTLHFADETYRNMLLVLLHKK